MKNMEEGFRPISTNIESKYEIAIVGNWSGFNFGAHLTQYALFCHLTDKGYHVLMLEKIDTEPFRPLSSPELFIENPYPKGALSKLYKTLSEAKEVNELCDTFIVGSDQLWNYKLFGHGMEGYTLSFVYDDKKKISYATSFGSDMFECPEEYKKKFQYLIHRFDSVSVREKSGISICRDMGVEATQVLDPVFLCDCEHYYDLIKKSDYKIKEPYIFCYILYPSEEKRSLIEKMSQAYGLRIVCVGDALFKERYEEWNLECIEKCKVEDWLKLIYESELVIADSFHAYCFSLIFHKQVISCPATTYTAGRMRSLADYFSLGKLYVVNELLQMDQQTIKEKTHIDYCKLSTVMRKKIFESEKWLENAIQSDKQVSEKCSFWDAYGTEFLDCIKKIKELELTNYRYEFEKKYSIYNVIIWGAGEKGRECYEKLSGKLHIYAFTDNDPEKWGKTVLNDIICIDPLSIATMSNIYVIISVADSVAIKNIKKQLLTMGIRNFTDFIGISEEWAGK